ncbi:hypothetical protein [Bdellovibrio svalbardensis]|uniref:Uncharacterized protein n=1 Tax=Bdellovibrio svalbardensis TaxID=2972972 RepID=A0ABT6DEX4_9BACT|nr:hypothetical protein [Bdellovibrio svalbardensis]MDG0814835.1 hypothetical protein [Bdellovibrio svalbardensis]
MKITQAIITVTILTIASTSFAGSKCSHMMSSQGNSLFAHTAAAPVSAQGSTTATTAAQQAVK